RRHTRFSRDWSSDVCSSDLEPYDNAGLLVGSPDDDVSHALLSLDCTEAVVDEAIELGCDVIISHHPIVFSGLKRFNGRTYVEREIGRASCRERVWIAVGGV